MTPREYLEEVAKPNIADLAADFGSVRKATNAVHSVDALAAHIYRAIGGKAGTGIADDTRFRGQLAKRSDAFRLVRDIAKALKHVELTRGGDPAVTGADQVVSKSVGWGEMGWGEGRWGGPPQVAVMTAPGKHQFIESILHEALDFLEREMASFGV